MTDKKLTDLKIKDGEGLELKMDDNAYVILKTKQGTLKRRRAKRLFVEMEDITPRHQMQRYILIIFLLECIVKDQWRNRNVVTIAKKDSDGIPFIEGGIEKYAIYIEFNGIHSWFKIPTAIMEKYGKKLLISFEQEFAPKWDGVHTSTETLLEFLVQIDHIEVDMPE